MSTKIPKKSDGTIDDRAFIINPELWPRWPHLPMKKPSRSGGWPQLGVLVDSSLVGELRFPAELHISDGASPSKVQEVKTFASVEAILADGWIVD